MKSRQVISSNPYLVRVLFLLVLIASVYLGVARQISMAGYGTDPSDALRMISPFIGSPLYIIGTLLVARLWPTKRRATLFCVALVWYGAATWLTLRVMRLHGIDIEGNWSRALLWLVVPIALELNWRSPTPLAPRKPKVLSTFVILTTGLAVLELLNLWPGTTYPVAILLHLAIPCLILAVRLLWRPHPMNRLLAIVSALVLPAAFTWMGRLMPQANGLCPPTLIIFLPLSLSTYATAQSYALFRRELGEWEWDIRRYLTVAIFWLVIANTALAMVGGLFGHSADACSAGSNWFYLVLFVGAAVFTVMTFSTATRTLRRHIFGELINIRDVVDNYVTRLSAMVFESSPLDNMIVELCGDLTVSRSLLCANDTSRGRLLHCHGMPAMHELDFDTSADAWKWVHLELCFETGGTCGRWLLGSKERDDFYCEFERSELKRLIYHIGATLEMRRLHEQIQADFEARERLLAAAQREGELASLGRLAADIAHELNTPFQAILNGLELTHKYPDDRRAQIWLQRTIDKTLEASALLEQILSFARPSGGIFTEVSVSDVIWKTVALLEHQIKLGQITMNMEVPGDLPEIWAVESRLQQVFSNLLINALEAVAPETGKITLRAWTEDTTVVVEVRDNGRGIMPDELDRLFVPWFTTKRQGVGLGLAIVYSIIQQHGGRIAAESNNGHGAIFTCWLPQHGRNTGGEDHDIAGRGRRDYAVASAGWAGVSEL